jgi:hypothetical protein
VEVVWMVVAEEEGGRGVWTRSRTPDRMLGSQ